MRLLAVLALPLAAVSSAAAHDECAQLKALSSARADSEVQRLADACAALPGLPVPERVAVLRRAAAIRAASGDKAAAELTLTTALDAAPDDVDALIALTESLRDRPDAALPVAARAAAAPAPEPRRVVALRLLAEVQAETGDGAAAQRSLSAALALAPADLDSLRALTRLKRGDPAALDAARRAERSAAAAPRWCRGAALRSAALTAADAGDDAGAMRILGGALALDPDDIKALRVMVQLRGRRPDLALPPPAAPPEARAAADELESLRARFDASRAAKRLAAAADLAERFSQAAEKAPLWQRYDAYRLSVEMWLALGDQERTRGALARLQDRDDVALETLRLWHRVYVGSTRGPGEGEWLANVVHLHRLLHDDGGAEAAADRWVARFPADRGVLAAAAELKEAAGKREEALALARRLRAAFETATDADMLSIVPDKTFFAGLNISESEKLQMSLQSAEMVAAARRDRANGLRASLELMARLDAALGREAEARAYVGRLEKEAEAAPPLDQADAYRRAARVRSALHDQDGAAADFARSLTLAPDDPGTLREALDLALARGRPVEGLPLAGRLEKTAREADPRVLAAAYLKTAEVHAALNDDAGAAESLQRALRLAPDDAPTLLRLVALEVRRGRPNEALQYAQRLEKVEEEQERDPVLRADAYRKTAQVKLALKDADGAAASLSKALGASPRDADALRESLDLELERGRLDAALGYADRLTAALDGAPAGARAAAYRARAAVQRARRDDDGAAQSLENALALTPEDPAVLAEAADLALALHRGTRALTYARRAEDVGAGTPAQRALAARRTARVQRSLKDLDGAADSLRRALAFAPDDAGALREAQETALERRLPGEALPYALRLEEAAAKSEPAVRADAARRAGEIQRVLGDEAAARAAFQRALALAPAGDRALRASLQAELEAGLPRKAPAGRSQDAGALQGSIERALSEGRFLDALADAERLLAAAKDASPGERAEAYRRRASVQAALKDAAGEEESLTRAREAAPKDTRVLRACAEFEAARGRPVEALADLRSAREAAPDDTQTLALLLDALRGRPAEARALFSAAPPADPSRRAEWLALRAQAAALDGDAAGARSDMDSAVAVDARAACYSPLFSAVRERLDPVYFDACVARFPKDADLYAGRGVARFTRGRVEDATADLRIAVELAPDDGEAALSLASALVAGGRTDEAARVLDRAQARVKRADPAVTERLRALRESLRAAAAKP